MESHCYFKQGNTSPEQSELQTKRSDSPEPSCVSMKSERSMAPFVNFKNEDSSPEHRSQRSPQVATSMKTHNTTKSQRWNKEEYKQGTEFQKELKLNLMKQFQYLNGVTAWQVEQKLLNEIYVELYITEGESGDINEEHEVRQIREASRRKMMAEIPIKCNAIFGTGGKQDKPFTPSLKRKVPKNNKPIRTGLMKGVAGIGKTVSVQKFILDWAEGKTNQDIELIFPLPFRELNLKKDQKMSLMELLHDCFLEIREIDLFRKVLFIFDGLDEYRFPLDFQNTVRVCDITKSAPVHVLLINLIKGILLPSALILITSRPAAADQIPSECVDRVTEVRGFNNPQKEEYFRKNISDQNLANNVIAHLKSLRSLYIMCHIPVFCRISSVVLQRMLGEAEGGEIPKTLTEIYTHFLIIQIKIIRQKYAEKQESDEEMFLKLGRLAFHQLKKRNLIFYEEDLRECGIDVTEAAVYSGVCTQIFREEFGIHQSKVYSFVHLSVQEHLAALHVHLTFMKEKRNALNQSRSFATISDVQIFAVDQALYSQSGHLDLFLRFLLGLSLESNHKLLCDLITQTGDISQTEKEKTSQYIKKMISRDLTTEKSINLFHCLSELGDNSLVEEVQRSLKFRKQTKLSSLQLSALVFVLLTSAENLEKFDLSRYFRREKTTETVLVKMMPVIEASRKAIIDCDEIKERSGEALVSALNSESSNLKQLHLTVNTLDLSLNGLTDRGVKQLCAVLKSPHCKVEKLALKGCGISDEGCTALSLALSLNPKHLRQLDLSNNNVGDPGVKSLCAVLENPDCKLETLSLKGCGVSDEGCIALSLALKSNPKHLRELDLSSNTVGNLGVNSLCTVLENSRCKLKTLCV